ncbi:hypothetical protein N0B51_05160 [Tsuneonella sp. YG55]|uniref:VanZ like family protein n=1 Tax=Tsuneonella litorea TaxID=2976475 RepID=A0A9X3AKH3_9SPHN|nr:hypothetical protein [Tsuneonella litorea]MCT2558364.1 hypothetical protein [Tsuneonella litorea]
MAVLPGVPDIPGKDGDKVQHMLAFFTLGALAAAGWRDRPAVLIFAMLAAFGGLIEIVQAIPALHADAQWGDWLADMAAAIVALATTRLILDRLPS